MTSIRRRVALSVCLALLGPAATAAAAKTIISESGSTSVYPLAVKLAQQYVGVNHGVGFRILQGGSDIGIDDVAHGRVTIGNASRDPIPGTDPHGLVFNKIARDGICVITNPSNPIGNLSQSEIQSIFSGQTSNWARVPGAGVRGAVDLITRTAASGTADAFQNIFMGPNLRVSGSAVPKSSNGLVQQAVRSDRNAIGFVSFDFTAGTHAVPYAGVPCTLRNAKSGEYGGVRNFWMVTRGSPTGAARSFLNWISHSGSARNIINSGWIAVH
jgi:phosphate transport system substrate-binding protein